MFRVAHLLGEKYANSKGISGEKNDLSAVTFIGKDRVLVFDDLERICTEKISIKEVLGLINRYVEHLHHKVIIVCNEEEYLPKESNEVKSDYSKYKEKSVRFTYQYESDDAFAYDQMVSGLKMDDYVTFLRDKKPFILSVFRLGGKKNLRTLKFFIDTFEKIYTLTLGVNNKDAVVNKCLLSYLLYVFECKGGESIENLLSLDNSRYKIDPSDFLGTYANSKNEETGRDYSARFKFKYETVFSDFWPCRYMIDFIVSGYLDIEKLKDEIKAIDAEIDRLVLEDQGKAYSKLQRMNELDDGDVRPLINEIMGYVRADKYNLYDLLIVYTLLLRYDYLKVENFELTAAIDEDFKASIERQRMTHVYNDLFDYRTPIWERGGDGKKQYEKYQEMKTLAIEANKFAKIKGEKEQGEQFLAAAEKGDLSELRRYSSENSHRISVSGIDWKKTLGLLRSAPNPIACEMCNCIRFFIPNEGFLNPDEMESVKTELIPELDAFLGEEKRWIRDFYVKDLRNHLAGIIR